MLRHCERSEALQSPSNNSGSLVALLLAMTGEPDLSSAAITSAVIAREGGRSSIPEANVINGRGRSVLDTPPARGM